jgi:hypothetical protein
MEFVEEPVKMRVMVVGNTRWQDRVGIPVSASIRSYEVYLDGVERVLVRNRTFGFVVSREFIEDVGVYLGGYFEAIEKVTFLRELGSVGEYPILYAEKMEGAVYPRIDGRMPASIYKGEYSGSLDAEISSRVSLVKGEGKGVIFQFRKGWEVRQLSEYYYDYLVYGRFAWVVLPVGYRRVDDQV